MTPMFLPSPGISSFSLGPLTIHFYALCILAGIFAGWWLARKRFVARGGEGDQMETIITVAVLVGIIGARLYHVVTDPQLFFGEGRNPWDAFKIWQGGLGILGGVAFGAVAVLVMCRQRGYSFPSMADVIAPALLLAQGIGRLGNWFNQELFGRPTTLPRGLQIDADHRPRGYAQYETFHPTFLYEMLWNFAGVGVLIWAERRFKLGHGRVFIAYLMWYAFGRFFIEGVRIDPANSAGGLRVNEWVTLSLFVVALVAFVLLSKFRPGVVEHPFGEPSAGEPDEDPVGGDEPVEDAPAEAEAPEADEDDAPEPAPTKAQE